MKINNFRNCFTHKSGVKAFTFVCLSGLTALGLAGCSDNDFDSAVNNQEKGTAVTFNVGVVGENAQATRALTRAAYADQLNDFGLKPEDLVDQKLAVEGNSDYCLVETTLPGILNEDFESNSKTRANIVTTETLGKFSAIGSRGSSASALSSWFHNEEVAANGTFKNTFYWAMSQPYAKFYAVYPQMNSTGTNLKLSDQGIATPYVDVVVEENATDQKDLMTACTGNTPVQYVTKGTAPVVPIKFQHAMTAIRFKVGDNIAAGHNITKIEIVNALSKGRFTLPSEVLAVSTGNLDRAWTDVKDRKTFKLSGISVSTTAENGIITGKDNRDNYTFYMIPQTLTGNNVKVNIYFDNSGSPAITSTLKGSWKAGTTKTYALSQKAGSFEYVLDRTSPGTAAKDATTTSEYRVQSYIIENGVRRPVKWKVVDYKVNGASVAKPEWLTSLSRVSGDGSTSVAGETGTATITQNVKDLLKERNEGLQNATAVTNYNLSNKTGADAIQNTANSYVISAPGTYRIPLVYGNAIKNQVANTSAYINTNPTIKLKADYPEDLLLHRFVDHLDKPINSPYINLQNNTNPATKAKLVWSDVSGIVSNEKVVNKTGSDDYLEFTVKKENMANGNAVVAVKDKDGVTMWSWHLWFAPKSALKPIEFTNSNRVYGFANEPLGWRYTKWTGSNEPRKVTVYVQQLSPAGTKKIANFTIQQKASVKDQEGNAALFQWGRKDALPGVATVAEGFYSFESTYTILPDNTTLTPDQKRTMESRTIGYAIQHPEYHLPKVGAGKLSWQYQQFINLWSANENKLQPATRDVVKSIYDPSPVGYQMPDPHAFTDFEITGLTWNKGYTFTNSAGQNLFFPAGGALNSNNGALIAHGTSGFYWTSGTSVQGGQLGYGQCFQGEARYYQ